MRNLGSLVLVWLVGCESGTAVVVDITIDEAAAMRFSSDQPGVLVGDANSVSAEPIAPICGAPQEAVVWVHDFGFGCLDDQKGTIESLRAWIAPIPSDWDAAAFCAIEVGYGALSIPVEVAADPSVPTEPPDGFPYGEGEATWKRDLSPCGGSAQGEITVRQAR